jgi:hypothetical protein
MLSPVRRRLGRRQLSGRLIPPPTSGQALAVTRCQDYLRTGAAVLHVIPGLPARCQHSAEQLICAADDAMSPADLPACYRSCNG